MMSIQDMLLTSDSFIDFTSQQQFTKHVLIFKNGRCREVYTKNIFKH